MSVIIKNILFLLLSEYSFCQEEDMPLGEGLVVVDASCDMKISSCASPPCRYFCPDDCLRSQQQRTTIFTQETVPCRDGQDLLSAQNAVDVLVEQDGTITLQTSVHSMSITRRQSQPYCTGDMSLTNDASICITTCALPDYECPRKYKQRCTCPTDKPILKDNNRGSCVSSIRECPPYNTYILPKDGLKQYKFLREPQDMIKKRGDKIRLHCVAGGSTNYQYYWYKSTSLAMGSHSIIRSSDEYLQQTGNSYLDINSVQPSDAGFYHCIVRTGDSVDPKDGKYSLVSNTGYLRVEYFNKPELGDTATIGTQEKALQAVLPCTLPRAEPPVQATWYRDEEKVSDVRMFTVPYNANVNNPQITRGALVVMMVTLDDAGVYTCKTTYEGEEYEVARVSLEVTGFIGQPNSDPEIAVEVPGRARVGESASFYCAGVGNPVPSISWSKDDGSRIETGDLVELSDFNRRLTLANVQPSMDRAYQCTAKSVGMRNARKTLLYLSILPSSYQINFVLTPVSVTIRPNVYSPFSLQCAITVDPVVEAPVMYWLKNGATLDMKPDSRIRTNTTENRINGTTIRKSTLIFITPNESDKGVYQCVVENKEQMRQATAYVDVIKAEEEDLYFPKEYFVGQDPLRVGEASEKCKAWRSKGHLVTIMNRNDSETVFRLLVERGLKQAWIGLTSENNIASTGVWNWQVGNSPPPFSYWYTDNPDNALGNETYAIVDVTKAGHWLDVRKDLEFPYVCSRYTAQCPSVAEFFNNSAEPVLSPVETSTTFYEVGKVLTVSCSDKQRGGNIKQRVECAPSGQFVPSSIPCPVRSGALSAGASSLCIALLLLLLAPS